MSNQTFLLRPRLARLAVLLAGAALVTACGGGGDGGMVGSGGGVGGGAAPSQPGGTVPDSAMSSMASFMSFIASWKIDDTIEPFALSEVPPPRGGGDAQPLN